MAGVLSSDTPAADESRLGREGRLGRSEVKSDVEAEVEAGADTEVEEEEEAGEEVDAEADADGADAVPDAEPLTSDARLPALPVLVARSDCMMKNEGQPPKSDGCKLERDDDDYRGQAVSMLCCAAGGSCAGSQVE